MKKILLTIALIFTSSLCLGHADHAPRVVTCASKECTKEQITTAVPTAIELLTKSAKIESSWSSAQVEKIEKKDFKKGPEWVVTLLDEKQPEGKKRRYIFITLKGRLNGSNLTGE